MKTAYNYRINQEKELEEIKQSRQRPLLEPSRKQRVLEWLGKSDKDDLTAWWNLNLLMLADEYGYIRNEFDFNLLESEGWKEADSQTREKIVEAAKKYIYKGEPENEKWLENDISYRPAHAGYRALFLLLNHSPTFVHNLSADVWRKWAATIILYPSDYSDYEKIAPHQFLISEAYKNAPDKIIKTISIQATAANEKDNDFFSKKLKVCWDEKFKAALREMLSNDSLKNNFWAKILTELFQHDDLHVQTIAESSLESFLTGKSNDERRALISATNLFRYAKNSGWWKFIWAAINKNADFGHKLVGAICHDRSLGNNLTENETADFYIWLERQYPFKTRRCLSDILLELILGKKSDIFVTLYWKI